MEPAGRICTRREDLAAESSHDTSRKARARLVAHTAFCATCLRNSPRRSAAIGIALVLLIALSSAGLWRFRVASREPGALLARLGSATQTTRPVEARLSGFAWAPFDAKRACAGRCTTPDQMIAAASLLSSLEREQSPHARHAAAVARLVTDGPSEALELLRAIPQREFDAPMWNDRSAAAIGAAQRQKQPSLLVNAIASADAALEIDRSFAPALFNRALAIERLGLRDVAAKAWSDYLAVDASGAWADEGRLHLRAVSPPFPAFKDLVARRRDAISRGDLRAAGELAALFPAETRIYGHTISLGAWGEELDRDPAAARAALDVARNLGRAMASRGDIFVTDCVAAIDAAKEPQRHDLALAHATFSRGRKILKDSPTAAEPLLRDAISRFSTTASAMAGAARYFHAIAVFDQNRLDEAQKELEILLRETPARQKSLRAQILWQLGLCYGARSEWGSTIRVLNESASIFEGVGDPYDAAVVRQILTEVYDVIGDHDTAWNTRIDVLHALGQSTTLRTETAVMGISYAAAQQRNWRLALSVLNIEVALGDQVRHGPSWLDAYLRRAVANRQLGHPEAAARDLEKARTITAGMNDGALRERGNADIVAVEAFNAATPQEAIARLSKAIDFHRTHGRELYVPTFLLERARAYRKTGDFVRARADIEAGIVQLEQDRETLPDAATRLGIFDAAAELFTSAIDDSLQRGDVSAAFAYAERARARALLDAVAPSHRPFTTRDGGRVPADAAVVEYVTLPGRLVAFVLTREQLVMVARTIAPDAIAADARRFREQLESGSAAAGPLGRRLYSQLVMPLERFVGTKRELVFVPDATLASFPFAALARPTGRFLVEDHTVVVAPSAAVHLDAAAREGEKKDDDVLVIASSSPGNAVELEGAEREASAIARIYPHATMLAHESATAAAFLSHAPTAGVIHFAGHALSAIDDGADTSLLMSGGDSGRLTLERIQSLNLRDTSVVVLAACNSARGAVHWSEGTLSVARAFLAAGAPTVIATLWEIDDERSAAFFIRLHEHLAGGTPPADALRATQIEWARRPGTVGQWAAIQAIGR